MYTGTRLTTAIHRRLSPRLFLRGGSLFTVLRLASSYKYHSIPLKRWDACCKKISLYCIFYPLNKILFTWSGGPRSSGVSFFCLVSLIAWKQKKPTPQGRGPPLHVNRVLNNAVCHTANHSLQFATLSWFIYFLFCSRSHIVFKYTIAIVLLFASLLTDTEVRITYK